MAADLIQLARQRKVERASAQPGNDDLVERWTAALEGGRAAPDDDPDDSDEGSLSDLTKAELLDRATKAGIEGRSTMNKDELIEALEEA